MYNHFRKQHTHICITQPSTFWVAVMLRPLALCCRHKLQRRRHHSYFEKKHPQVKMLKRGSWIHQTFQSNLFHQKYICRWCQIWLPTVKINVVSKPKQVLTSYVKEIQEADCALSHFSRASSIPFLYLICRIRLQSLFQINLDSNTS